MRRTKEEIEFEVTNTLQKYEEIFGATLEEVKMRRWIYDHVREQEDNFFFSRLGHWRERDARMALEVIDERLRSERVEPKTEIRQSSDPAPASGERGLKPGDGPEVGYDEGALRKQRGRPRSEKTVLS